MSTPLKKNNRFSSLLDETPESNQYSNRSNRTEKRNISNFSNLVKSQEHNVFNKNKNKNKVPINLLDENNFPSLMPAKKQNNIDYECKYIDKINKNIDANKNTDDTILPLGWITVTHDKITNKSIMSYKNKKNKVESEVSVSEIIDNLVILHENRTDDYINLWGEHEYETVFLFPNYDYNFFDRCDEEEELERLAEMNENEIINDYDKYSE